MSFSGIELGEEANAEEDSDDGSQAGEKKRRLNMEQVKTLEKSFELGNKLEPERKMHVTSMPLSLSFFFFVGCWLYRPCNYDNYFCFSSMHKFSFDDEF